MRRLVYGLLAVVMGFGSVGAKIHTNKTFLMPRSHNENMAMEYTGWHKQFRKRDVSRWDGMLQATAFYQASTNKTDLGKYFGKYNNATGPLLNNAAFKPNLYCGEIQDFIWITDRQPLKTSAYQSNEHALLLSAPRMIHDGSGNVSNHWDAKITLRPRQKSYGVILDWHQKLDKLTKGMYFKASIPVVHVKTDLNTCITGDRFIQDNPSYASGDTVHVMSYFNGSYALTGTQKALKYAKICGSDTVSGIADLDFTLGYNFLYKEHKHFGVNLALTVPTTSKPTGEYLFEAALGYGGHWALGMGLDCAFELWQHGKKSLEFVGALNYKYVLEATEHRTVGVKYPDNLLGSSDGYALAGKRIPMAHYFVGAQKGEQEVFPLANVLTQDVGVAPGSRVELLANLAFNWGRLTFDAGYNLFAKEAECITIKCWRDDQYMFVNPDIEITDGFEFNVANHAYFSDYYIQQADLLPQDAATPVYVTHKALFGATYAFNKWDYPMMVGLGASWEFVQGSNSAIDGYAVWLKGGVTF